MPPESAPDAVDLAVVLAGGKGRRLGMVDKPSLTLHGRSLLEIALAAVGGAVTVVVGPARTLPPEVIPAREDPPGGGPAAGVVAGLRSLAHTAAGRGSTDDLLVAVLAADLPGIDPAAVRALVAAMRRSGAAGAVLTDPGGRDQYLAGVWRFGKLVAAAAARPDWHGGRVSELLGPLIGARVPADERTTADADTPEALVRWGVRRADERAGEVRTD